MNESVLTVGKCFSCFRDVKFGVTGQRRHVPAVQPVTVNYGSIVFRRLLLISLSCPSLVLFLSSSIFSSFNSSKSSFLLSHSFSLVENYGYSDRFRGLLSVVPSGYV